ncbi:ferredoxin--NADP reductase [Azohydromonas caseinilytica]|uniref:Ferredoxin--NADP reductase n=1 Tax=Azohydromonas caseinilytica TaxID=2728836 RepID=A0A848F971_9BURK|nr:ferredoxin--NADP reductase [Azohydromonas caseinilytica]NML16687.1 ferredoxin--NADP reductase [Azohydromonas caseinilytica]
MKQRLRVREVVRETHDTVSLVFDLPPSEALSFRHRPGQFLTLHLPVEPGRVLRRCYSMSSAPGLDDGFLRVTVKRVAQGRGSNWVCDRIRAGDEVEVLAPAGVFTPRSLEGDFVLLGGGSGITPLFSILRSVLAQGTGRVLLFYANRDERSVIFAAALRALADAHPQRLQIVHWLDSVQGPPGVSQMAALLRAWRGAQAFICGPGPFMDAACTALREAGAADELIHVERFASLPDEDATPPDAAAAQQEPPPPAVASAELRIELDGAEHRIRCAGEQTLLQAARQAGIELPHSCEAGLCASCMCQVVQGQVHLRHNEALDARDLARSWTLACQATPASEQIHIKFPR